MELYDKLAALFGIRGSLVKHFFDYLPYVICNDILNNYKEGTAITEEDLGIGTLSIKVDADTIKYKFTPSKSFEGALLKTVEDKKSPLVARLETIIGQRLSSEYKDLI